MGWLTGLAGIMAGFFRVLLAYRLVVISTKVATRVAILAIIVALFLGVLAAISALVSSLSVAVPNSILVAYSWIVPSNFVPCLTAIITTQVLIWAWHWKKYSIDFVSAGAN